MKEGKQWLPTLRFSTVHAVARCTLKFAAVLTVFTDVSVLGHTVPDFFVSTSLYFFSTSFQCCCHPQINTKDNVLM